ncbi:MAG TPA: FadR/GntR family transcriptional regulator [Acidimicrobiales bacterium]|nr:FadR/GntR family transcriptional regulator [Acidimicrobiales bacterium]
MTRARATPVEDRAARRALPASVAEQVEEWILTERFNSGGRLPPERQLAATLGTSRNVLREALRILETRGTVEVRHGVGAFVADTVGTSVVLPLQMRLESVQLPVEEVSVARQTIECAVVGFAARARDELDLQELRSLLDRSVRAAEAQDREQFGEAALSFHEALGACTHNRLLRDIQTGLTRTTANVRGLVSDPEAMQASLRFHTKLFEAVVARDAGLASAVMLMHLLDDGERVMATLHNEAVAESTSLKGRQQSVRASNPVNVRNADRSTRRTSP